jgi:hypothetical protein
MPSITRKVDTNGLLVDVVVAVNEARRSNLERLGMTVPLPVHLRAMIDTGSTISGFALAIFPVLGLIAPNDYQEVITCSAVGKPHKAPAHYADVMLIGAPGEKIFSNLRVLGFEFGDSEGCTGLIGRDILDQCHLVYEGRAGRFTLAF